MVGYLVRIHGKVSRRVELALNRAYLHGYRYKRRWEIPIKPIEELTDEELLAIWGIGRKSLDEIHQALKGGKPCNHTTKTQTRK